MTAYFFKLISLLGGLSLFLFGMDTMGKALERTAGGKLQTILAKMSSSVPKGFLLGMASLVLLCRELGLSPDRILQDRAGSQMLLEETKGGARHV